MARIKGYIVVTVRFSEEGRQWSAVCRELGTAACGDTFEEAREAIEDLMLLHLKALEDAGTRQEFFKKHGIKFFKQKPKTVTCDSPLHAGEVVAPITLPIAA
jgi:predicted RNase H-like HicB family nuclease